MIVELDQISREALERMVPIDFVGVALTVTEAYDQTPVRAPARGWRVRREGAGEPDLCWPTLEECFSGVVPAILATASSAGVPNVTYLSRRMRSMPSGSRCPTSSCRRRLGTWPRTRPAA